MDAGFPCKSEELKVYPSSAPRGSQKGCEYSAVAFWLQRRVEVGTRGAVPRGLPGLMRGTARELGSSWDCHRYPAAWEWTPALEGQIVSSQSPWRHSVVPKFNRHVLYLPSTCCQHPPCSRWQPSSLCPPTWSAEQSLCPETFILQMLNLWTAANWNLRGPLAPWAPGSPWWENRSSASSCNESTALTAPTSTI